LAELDPDQVYNPDGSIEPKTKNIFKVVRPHNRKGSESSSQEHEEEGKQMQEALYLSTPMQVPCNPVALDIGGIHSTVQASMNLS
jgi:hypothetical protein